MTGNKGAVAIRLVIHDTSFCFITSHFAAGHSAVEDRNNDYRTITRDLRFSRGKDLMSHDVIFWAGDFNYRIEGDSASVRQMISMRGRKDLLRDDQLLAARRNQRIFEGFDEGEIHFDPTYKFDFYSDDYDTSEKFRVPAWTDRIMFRGKGVRHSAHCHLSILIPARSTSRTIKAPASASVTIDQVSASLSLFPPRLIGLVYGVFSIALRKVDHDVKEKLMRQYTAEESLSTASQSELHHVFHLHSADETSQAMRQHPICLLSCKRCGGSARVRS